MIALRDNQAYLTDDLALAVAAVRMLRPDDIYIAIPWSRTAVIEACVDAFLRTPAEIHLGSEAILERFKEARVVQFGPIAGLGLTRPPLTRLQRAEKRAFDVVAATLGLIALAPLFALVGLCIRLEGPGPILFRQTRYGFNQEPFRIFKFRTMTTMEDGAEVKAATRADPRVTRVGAFLRRFSIDELPQLLNVLMGEMSIVGPRPHALAHDHAMSRASRATRAGTTSSPASPAGRRSAAIAAKSATTRTWRRASSTISITSTIGRCGSTSRSSSRRRFPRRPIRTRIDHLGVGAAPGVRDRLEHEAGKTRAVRLRGVDPDRALRLSRP